MITYLKNTAALLTSLSFLGTPAERGMNKDVWIALRTDNKAGAGTPEDPFDGSTAAKFDALMRGVSPNTTVNIGPGIFLTTGSASYNATDGYYLPSGVKIHGAGMYDTTVRCTIYPAGAGANGHNVLEMSIYTDGAGVEVSDLTVDCNWQNLGAATATKTSAVKLHGNNCKIRRVRAINSYGNFAALTESFGLVIFSHIIGGTWQACKGAEISDCVAELFQGDYGGAITLLGSGDGAVTGTISGVLLRNRIYDWLGTSALGAMGNGIEIAGNYTYNCKKSVYADTGEFKNISIHDNIFAKAGFNGISLKPSLGNAHVEDVVIARNIIQIADINTSTSIAIELSENPNGPIDNVVIEENIITDFPTGNGVVHNGINCALANGVIVRDNTVDSILAHNLYIGGAYPNTALTVKGNLTPAGIAPVGLADFSSNMPIGSQSAISLTGTLRTSADRTAAGQYWAYKIVLASDYTVVAGDSLVCRVYVDPASASFCLKTGLLNTAGAEPGVNTLRDQNGRLGYADLKSYADGAFYFRTFLLDPIAGTVLRDFIFGGGANNETGTPALAGVSTYSLANIKIISSSGALRRAIYTEDVMSSTPTISGGYTASNLMVTPFYLGALFKYLPTADPLILGTLWNNSGVVTVSNG